MTRAALALDIGGTKLAAALVTADGQVRGRRQCPTPAAEGPTAVLDAAATLLTGGAAGAAAAMTPPHALGVAAAGVVDPGTGSVVSAVATLARWAGAQVGPVLSARTGLPTTVDNDVNAMGVAEARLGAARGFPSALFLAVGTGVGGAIVLNGRLWRGATFSAGEIGHIPVALGAGPLQDSLCNCGRRGHLEAVASGPAIAARYAQRSGRSDAPSLEAVHALAQDGDRTAIEVIRETGNLLGRALGGLLNVLDVAVVVVGGGVLSLGTHLWDPLVAAARAEARPGPARAIVRRSALGVDAALVGAALLALDHERSE